jgi:hypothetical protein
MVALRANDDQLDDEFLETEPILCTLVSGPDPTGLTIAFDVTDCTLEFAAHDAPGVYEFTYQAQRVTEEGGLISSLANVIFTILALEDPDDDDGDGDGDGDGDEDGDSDEDSDDEGNKRSSSGPDHAELPDTGAADNLNLLGGTGIALTILGMFTVVANPRRRAGTHRA